MASRQAVGLVMERGTTWAPEREAAMKTIEGIVPILLAQGDGLFTVVVPEGVGRPQTCFYCASCKRAWLRAVEKDVPIAPMLAAGAVIGGASREGCRHADRILNALYPLPEIP